MCARDVMCASFGRTNSGAYVDSCVYAGGWTGSAVARIEYNVNCKIGSVLWLQNTYFLHNSPVAHHHYSYNFISIYSATEKMHANFIRIAHSHRTTN